MTRGVIGFLMAMPIALVVLLLILL